MKINANEITNISETTSNSSSPVINLNHGGRSSGVFGNTRLFKWNNFTAVSLVKSEIDNPHQLNNSNSNGMLMTMHQSLHQLSLLTTFDQEVESNNEGSNSSGVNTSTANNQDWDFKHELLVKSLQVSFVCTKSLLLHIHYRSNKYLVIMFMRKLTVKVSNTDFMVMFCLSHVNVVTCNTEYVI